MTHDECAVGLPVRLSLPDHPAAYRAGQEGRIDRIVPPTYRPSRDPGAPPERLPDLVWVTYPDGIRGCHRPEELEAVA